MWQYQLKANSIHIKFCDVMYMYMYMYMCMYICALVLLVTITKFKTYMYSQ